MAELFNEYGTHEGGLGRAHRLLNGLSLVQTGNLSPQAFDKHVRGGEFSNLVPTAQMLGREALAETASSKFGRKEFLMGMEGTWSYYIYRDEPGIDMDQLSASERRAEEKLRKEQERESQIDEIVQGHWDRDDDPVANLELVETQNSEAHEWAARLLAKAQGRPFPGDGNLKFSHSALEEAQLGADLTQLRLEAAQKYLEQNPPYESNLPIAA